VAAARSQGRAPAAVRADGGGAPGGLRDGRREGLRHRVLGEVHETLAWWLVALVALHVAAAAWHRLVLRDDVLGRMLPARTLR
jgi:cytochrome b